MITKYKIFEATERGKEIVYTLNTKAITYSGSAVYKYNVNILQGGSEYPDKYDHLILSVEGTPGSWYISTLMEHGSFYRNKAVIDGGQNWTVDNWDEVSKEFLEILPELKVRIEANKYNL